MQELHQEMKLLKTRQAELEKVIQYDWRDLKESAKPRHMADQAVTTLFRGTNTHQGNSLIVNSLSDVAQTFAKKGVEKLGELLRKRFGK